MSIESALNELNKTENQPSRSDLLDRIKVLEGENETLNRKLKDAELPTSAHIQDIYALTNAREEVVDLKSLLHRCLNTGLRHKDDLPLYLEVCRVLGVDPDKPWEEK